MKDEQVKNLNALLNQAQFQIDIAQGTIEELRASLNQVVTDNKPAQREFKIGDYVISKNRPHIHQCGKVTSATKAFLTITDDETDKTFKKARRNVSLL